MSSLEKSDKVVFDILQNELERQTDHLEMIASENFTYPEVMEVMVYDAALTSAGLNKSLIDGEVNGRTITAHASFRVSACLSALFTPSRGACSCMKKEITNYIPSRDEDHPTAPHRRRHPRSPHTNIDIHP